VILVLALFAWPSLRCLAWLTSHSIDHPSHQEQFGLIKMACVLYITRQKNRKQNIFVLEKNYSSSTSHPAGWGGMMNHLLIKLRPSEVAAKLPCDGTLGIVTITTQVAKAHAALSSKNSGKQEREKLRPWLGESRHML
jgi:NADH:ubiquinone oxidoreductase subunit